MRSLGKNMTALLATLAAIGCGGSSDGGAQGTEGPTSGAPVSDAGPDQEASFGFRVWLDGELSSDPEGEALTWTWRQVRGPDVTDGRGTFDGPTPSFVAPEAVATLVFDLRVSDGSNESETDTVTVRVFEDHLAAFFVDGDVGDDELGNGSREAPFASIAKALCEVTESRQDIYVMSRADGARYDETADPCPGEPPRSADRILAVPTGTSLYGGFNADWSRDVEGNRTGVDLLHHGVQFEAVDQSARLSGFDLSAADSPEPDDSVFVVRAVGGTASLAITDNVMTAGNVAAGTAPAPGTSHGLLLAWLDRIDVRRNVIIAGRGGSAAAVGNVFNSAATAGGDAVGTSRGDGKGPEDYDGGGGGAPGYQGGENGARGDRGEGSGGIGGCGGGQGSGGANCVGEQQSGDNGRRGADGGSGSGGSLGESGAGHGWVNAWVEGTTAFAAYVPGNGGSGTRGTAGRGGGGGGGGEANTGVNGGRGGGGGGGGAGGRGGPGGLGGGASIGIFVVGVVEAAIHDNQVTADAGGDGGSGGAGQLGGGGGTGGAGADGNNGAFGITGGHGGNGGNGGPGGPGGHGGAGGGGASFGLLVGANTAPAVSGNTILAGAGGRGGAGAGGHGGAGGYSYAVYDETPDDGAVPALTDNQLEAGLPGAGGSSTTGDAGDAGLAGPRNF